MKNYPLEKYHFYVHGNRVIATSTYAGRVVRGVAICAGIDEFDLEKGKRLAAARCNAKIALKRFQRAKKRRHEAQTAVSNARAFFDRMDNYYDDALEAYDIAMRDIEKLESEF